jgi:hypothetical protein
MSSGALSYPLFDMDNHLYETKRVTLSVPISAALIGVDAVEVNSLRGC